MSVIAPQHKRPLFFDLVEVLRRRLEVIVVKLYRFEPIIRAFPFLVEALLNHGLERFERGRLDIDIGETALRAVDRAFDRMDVCVDQSGENQFPAKVDHLCLRSDQRRDLGIIANGDNAVACEGDRLPDRARRVGRIDLPIPEHHISLSILGGADIVKPETGNEANDDC